MSPSFSLSTIITSMYWRHCPWHSYQVAPWLQSHSAEISQILADMWHSKWKFRRYPDKVACHWPLRWDKAKYVLTDLPSVGKFAETNRVANVQYPAVLPQAQSYSPKELLCHLVITLNMSQTEEEILAECKSKSWTGKEQLNLSRWKPSESRGNKSYAVQAPSEGRSVRCARELREAAVLPSGSSTGTDRPTGYNNGEESFHTYSVSYSSRPTKTWWNEGLALYQRWPIQTLMLVLVRVTVKATNKQTNKLKKLEHKI